MKTGEPENRSVSQVVDLLGFFIEKGVLFSYYLVSFAS